MPGKLLPGVPAGTVGTAAVLGVTDPTTWSGGDWLADILPHLVYGLVTAATFDVLPSAA